MTTSTVTLLASQNGTRVRINAPSAQPSIINVQVGATTETWSVGTYIEVVRLATTLGTVNIVNAAGATLNQLSGTNVLAAGEYARVSLNPDTSWDLHIYRLPVASTGGGKPRPLTVNTIAAGATTANLGSAGDHNTTLRSLATAACSITVKNDSFWSGTDLYWTNDFNPSNPGPMPIGGSLIIGKHGTGNVTFVPDTGVTINCADTLVMDTVNAKVSLTKVGANEWDLAGRLVP